jgi:hypothetical protein
VGREAVVVNLDPANDVGERDIKYGEEQPYVLDINELVALEDVMEELNLGPNGGMVYCMEFLENNIEWLESKLKELLETNPNVYFLFDLPGQVEISAHHESLRNIMMTIQKRLDLRLTAVHLVDAVHCSDPSKYISAVFLSLSTMLRLELPHVNVLSKIDLVEQDGTLDFNLEFYTDVMDLEYLLPLLAKTPQYLQQSPDNEGDDDDEEGDDFDDEQDENQPLPGPPTTFFEEKYKKLNGAIVGLIDQFSLVAFHPLNIQEKESVLRLIKHIDKTNEYINVMTTEESDLLEGGSEYIDMAALTERYMPGAFA